jgi:hypothetical protein
MRSDGFQECIVTFIDLIGIKELAKGGQGSALMMEMHQRVKSQIQAGHLASHPYAYLWNDSVLLLAYLNDQESRSVQKNRILKEADNLRKKIDVDLELKSFGISVQGMAFPDNQISASVFTGEQAADRPDVVILKASSWAFANCFEIDKNLRKHRATWYIDSRISEMLQTDEPIDKTASVKMLPDGKKRPVDMYKTYLWAGIHAN